VWAEAQKGGNDDVPKSAAQVSPLRRFANQARPCQVTSRNWMPPARFRHGRYTATLRAVDKAGRTSGTVSRSLTFR